MTRRNWYREAACRDRRTRRGCYVVGGVLRAPTALRGRLQPGVGKGDFRRISGEAPRGRLAGPQVPQGVIRGRGRPLGGRWRSGDASCWGASGSVAMPARGHLRLRTNPGRQLPTGDSSFPARGGNKLRRGTGTFCKISRLCRKKMDSPTMQHQQSKAKQSNRRPSKKVARQF